MHAEHRAVLGHVGADLRQRRSLGLAHDLPAAADMYGGARDGGLHLYGGSGLLRGWKLVR